MARRRKSGLYYFPLDTDFFSNDKVKSLRRKFGTVGILCYVSILCKIYNNGYFYRFYDIEDLCYDVAEQINNVQIRKTAETVRHVIDYMVELEILAEELFEVGILTGVKIQEQFVVTSEKLRRKTVLSEFGLVDVGEVLKKNRENAEESDISSEEKGISSEETTRKEKGNEKEKSFSTTTTTTTADARDAPPFLAEIYMFFKNETDVTEPLEEAQTFFAYNEKRGWDCLPEWRGAALLWEARGRKRGLSL